MLDDPPPPWKAVEDDVGRTYYWNIDTDETSWVKPMAPGATPKSVPPIPGYLNAHPKSSNNAPDSEALRRKSDPQMVNASRSSAAGADPELEALRRKSSVTALTA
eukprot:1438732-Prymnesium_polylepis.1